MSETAQRTLFSQSAEETYHFGYHLGKQLTPNTVLCFFGDLAAGKTTFIKGVAAGAAQIDPDFVQSPTFTYLNIYEGQTSVYHFDLYRLKDIDEFLSMGFDEYFDAQGICCIEWSERISAYLPANSIHISLFHDGEGRRRIIIL